MKALPFSFSSALLAMSISPGKLIGILIGVLLLILIVVFICVILHRRGRWKARAAEEVDAEPARKEPPEDVAPIEDEKAAEPEEEPEEPITLKESIAVAKHAAHSVKWGKKTIAEYLRVRHAGEIEINERVTHTTTGLPLADTHYAVDHKTRKCFVYVYETEGSPLLLINSDAELAAELNGRHGNVHKSAFPKSKDQWYSLPLDDTYSKEEVQSVLDRCHAHVLGRDAKAIKLQASLPDPVAVISASEVDALISDEAAEAAIENDNVKVKVTGKKEIVNVDSLSACFQSGDTITVQALAEKGLISKKAGQVKLLAHGTLDKVFHVELQDFSIEAAKMIIATGGTVKRVPSPAEKK